MSENPLRALPKMDLLLAVPTLAQAGASLPRPILRHAARAVLEDLRQDLARSAATRVPDLECIAALVLARAGGLGRPHLRRVINATGVVLHTNLGRAPLAESAIRAVCEAGAGYSNLEYNLDAGTRGSRFSHVEELLCRLTGGEAALVVNNNAAAVFLMLSALAPGKGVAISRGELVEIGGGFRVPDMMARSGARLIEVGTTNKTRIADYRAAISRDGAEVLLKVHTSNYAIVGFTEETPLEALVTLGRQTGLPVLYDLGSGLISRDFLPGLPAGPTMTDALAAGCGVVCASGDKLLGGPQCGIAIGKKHLIDAMKRDPMARVTRIDKLSLAALEATLLLCSDPESAIAAIPTLAMLNASPGHLEARAEQLAAGLSALCGEFCTAEVLAVEGEVGGGAMPCCPLPSYAVALTPRGGHPEALEAALRAAPVPVIGRMSHGRVLLDVRTMGDEAPEDLLSNLHSAIISGLG